MMAAKASATERHRRTFSSIASLSTETVLAERCHYGVTKNGTLLSKV